MSSSRPFLLGFSFHVADTVDVDAWAERFGFGPLPPSRGRGQDRTLLLPQGVVWWSTEQAPRFKDLDTRIGTPVSWVRFGPAGPRPVAEPMENPVPCPPNGAVRPLRAIAVMNDNPALVDAFTFRHNPDDERVIHYAGNFPSPQIGALVHDALYPRGYYRFIFSTDSKGPAARWLRQGPPRWIGVVFEVADLAATEQALAQRGVATVHVHEHIGEALWVMPEVTGGPLLDFVQPKYR